MKPRVLICQGVVYQQPGDYSRILESAGFEVLYPVPGGGVLSEEELAANLPGIDATIASMERYSPEILRTFDRLKVISRCGVGLDSVDLAAATAAGTLVAITPDCNHEAVAEHAMALLLAAAKRVIDNHRLVAGGGFRRQPTLPLRGRTLGIVGLGRIGREVARRATAFGMRVIATRASQPRGGDEMGGAAIVPLEQLLAESHYISLHVPLCAETQHLICRDTISRMIDGAVLINTSRGGLVDEDALAEALDSGKVAAAGIDVFAHEPPTDSPLLTAPNVVFSPHVAGADEESFHAMVTTAAQTIVDLYQGRWPEDRLVNGDALQ